MKSKIFLLLIIFCFSCFSEPAVAAGKITASEAEVWANQKGRQLLDTFSEPDVKTKYAKLDEMFLNDVDLEYVGKFVVGKYWRQMTPEQRQRYIPLFKRYSLSLYKNFPLSFDFKINFKITGVKLDRDYADVTADISLDGRQQPGQPAEKFLVGFRIHKVGGKLKIIDLKLAESSLILSYRGRFYEMLRRNDDEIEWFLEDLELITSSAEQQNQMTLTGQNL